MNHWLAKKMYKIHGFCFDCTVDYEAKLRKAGLYEKYEKNMMKGNAYSFVNDLKAYVNNFVEYESTFVTEHGDVEDWNNNSNIQNKKVLDGLDEYLKIIDKHFS